MFELIVLLDRGFTFLFLLFILLTKRNEQNEDGLNWLSAWVCSQDVLKILVNLSLKILIKKILMKKKVHSKTRCKFWDTDLSKFAKRWGNHNLWDRQLIFNLKRLFFIFCSLLVCLLSLGASLLFLTIYHKIIVKKIFYRKIRGNTTGTYNKSCGNWIKMLKKEVCCSYLFEIRWVVRALSS